MAYEYELLKVDVDEGVATVLLNRPPLNPMNVVLFTEIGQCARELSFDDDVRSVVITGGEEHFAAGADIREMVDASAIEVTKAIRLVQASFSAVEDIPKPVIAAINGFALGGGCELAICCDFRFAHEKALIGQPEILLGVIPGAGGTQRLPRLIGPALAKEMIYSGKAYTAARCHEMGLVQKVVTGEDSVIELARKVAGGYAKGAAVALAMAKRAVNKGTECSMEEGLIIEAHGISLCFASEDQKIGMRTFLDEGPGKARFTGR
ncbi:MAG: enoyl-CoA hydratase/isomerase family protein [Actinobacteria bacterium]|nr:enoyl-CoA hydratase/isomerase family protein [Actinomycetota bacterium]MBU1945031.1 enoyl-CoA hydratase/isomerase family protein [Actinomycetota bacterium]MBU2686633.1 enoyl-CoA hydratase/isomerase family protein [Actinomycetota bacterium]